VLQEFNAVNCAIRKVMVKATDSFSTGDAVRITGVSFRNIDYWARTKFIVPSIAEAQGTGTERKYSFSDLLALRVARELREAGVSTQSLRRVVEFLRTKKGLTQPLAECRLIVTGTDVQVASSPEKIMSVLRTPGQTSFAFVFDLRRTVDEMKEEIKATERKPPTRAWTAQPARVRATRRAV
jgi:DNA-binding transcriptional MerR regulator